MNKEKKLIQLEKEIKKLKKFQKKPKTFSEKLAENEDIMAFATIASMAGTIKLLHSLSK